MHIPNIKNVILVTSVSDLVAYIIRCILFFFLLLSHAHVCVCEHVWESTSLYLQLQSSCTSLVLYDVPLFKTTAQEYHYILSM